MHRIKCHQCGNWSQGSVENCEVCGVILDKNVYLKSISEERNPKEKSSRPDFFIINKEDGVLLVIWKRILQAGYLVFMAIMSFIIWFVALFSG
jgi:hypothetical protein